MGEARTIREARLQVREAEASVERIHMAPAASLAILAEWYLRKARLALRQAERAMAKADDPRLDPLEPMRAQLRDRRPSTKPLRRRHRCPVCFTEGLMDEHELRYYAERGHGRGCGGTFEPVARRKPRKGTKA